MFCLVLSLNLFPVTLLLVEFFIRTAQLSLLDEEFIEHSHSPAEPLKHRSESEMLPGEENGESLEASDSEDLSSDEVDGVINRTKTTYTEPELLFSPAQPDGITCITHATLHNALTSTLGYSITGNVL